MQAVGGLAIIVWTCATAGATFVAVNALVGMRVTADVEEAGLDVSEHGAVGDAWAPGAPLKVEAAGPVKVDGYNNGGAPMMQYAAPPQAAPQVNMGYVGGSYGQA